MFIRKIAALLELVAIGRTHVRRDGYGNREIEYVTQPESNTRISKSLASLATDIAALNRHPEVAPAEYEDVVRTPSTVCLTAAQDPAYLDER